MTQSRDLPTGGRLRLVLGDQLSRGISSLEGIDRERDVVLLAEVADEATYVRHHPKKIAFCFSAMRHFAAALAEEGVTVRYVKLDDQDNSGSLEGEVARALEDLRPSEVVVTEPGEWRLWSRMLEWEGRFGIPVQIREDDRFFCARADFADWAEGRKQPRMENFYRSMRKRHGILMRKDSKPAGEAWNLDKENRKTIPDDVAAPAIPAFEPDETTQEVLKLVEDRFGDHFGRLDGFSFAVTAEDAEAAFEDFVSRRLPNFGDYQDAMRAGDPMLFHSVISIYLNAGLLDARGLCARAEQAYRDGHAPLNAVEGFIRQILGWREYVRGIYWLKMPDYKETNGLDAKRQLPDFYWTGETDMACMAETIGQTAELAYAHHIQRLMVTGNFALLAGIDPAEVNEWYMIVYADAYEWVELPNVQGMALHADGGYLGSKPYAASGKYIDRMSDYCKNCRYNVKRREGEGACPFNFLYWNFLAEHRERFQNNPRMAMVLRTLDRMDPKEVKAMRAQARDFLDTVAPAPCEAEKERA